MSSIASSDPFRVVTCITYTRANRRAIFVLGTPVEQDARRRMARAIALLRRDPESIIVALGNRSEAAYMKNVALETGLPPSRLIVAENSKTTIDNGYFAKQICRRLDLRPELLVTSQYQVSRAAIIFERVFGPNYPLKTSPSPSLTSMSRRLRETTLRILIPIPLFLFRKGDDEALKRASDRVWKLLFH